MTNLMAPERLDIENPELEPIENNSFRASNVQTGQAIRFNLNGKLHSLKIVDIAGSAMTVMLAEIDDNGNPITAPSTETLDLNGEVNLRLYNDENSAMDLVQLEEINPKSGATLVLKNIQPLI